MKFISHHRHKLLVVIAVLSICLTGGILSYAESDGPARVLFINSYNYSYGIVPGQVEGVRQICEKEGLILDIEFMDTKRFNTDENYENYYEFLSYRLANTEPYDVILSSDDNALEFLRDHRETLTGDIPIIFFGINNTDTVFSAAGEEGIYGLYETTSIRENLELAMGLVPNAKEFLIITDNTPTGIGDANSYMAYAPQYENMTFTNVDFSQYTLDEFKHYLQNINENQILIYMTMLIDKDGISYTIDEAIDILAENASVPVFRPTIGGVGEGLLGGFMKSYEEQGRIAARYAVKLINNEEMPVDGLILERPNLYTVDYNVMTQYGLPVEALPEGTIIINRPLTFTEKYEQIFLPVGLVLGGFLIIILILIRDNRRRRDIEISLLEKNLALENLSEELTASEEELRSQNELLEDSREQLAESEQRYKELAMLDALTGLKNRYALRNELEDVLQQGSRGTIYFIDLDQFKYVNDSFGHLTGDAVLQEVGKRLSTLENKQVNVNRIGGDEFVLVAVETQRISDVSPAYDYSKSLSQILEKAIIIDEQAFYMTCSVGIVRFPEHGMTASELIRKADIAMYQAKEAGRGRAVIYSALMDVEASSILGMQNNIRQALEKDEFVLYLQPQLAMDTGKITGFEGLIRWQKSNGEIVSPGHFIPIAEQLGIIHHIGTWVLNRACHMLKDLKSKSDVGIKIAVNVSAIELTRLDFAEEFMAVLNSHSINPEDIVIELTESILLDSAREYLDKLNFLRNQGIEIHLDDFGTGYSSLNYLRTLPIDVVKIDRSFIVDIESNEKQRSLTKSIIEIAHNIGKTVIAEGVENEAQVELLRSVGCDMVQGFYFAKPMPYEQILEFIQCNDERSSLLEEN